ncbi:E3 ubiquitin-protein ligase ZNRF4 [Trichosurus vulpecula]|uniref:E3 ubiquitin-protein ligase ZNRF4 n=1 Tax=Trichosurus vulpecula TaxID=9337 RepID=UPI00186B565A|nr:E3 ubiquitin-protein ligase ZNRF4 [Trichosurus vulpecula]XP_036613255.1 E3 ubiquitin-protein ligase ZNRF4 [Trichosurus vulpecula]
MAFHFLRPMVFLFLLLELPASKALVRAVANDSASAVDFSDAPALFGAPLSEDGVRGYLIEARPPNACQPIEGPMISNHSLGSIALVRRFDCTFDLKVLHAQQAGYQAVIVHNVHSNDLVNMVHVYDDIRQQIEIPSVFVSEATSKDLRGILCGNKDAHVLLLPNHQHYSELDCHPVLSISWVLGRMVTLLISTLLIIRKVWLYWWQWRERGTVAKTPSRKKTHLRSFTRQNDVCAICLDEYEEGDQLKVLPCTHIYHRKCIDPWFSQTLRRTCPVCKQPVVSAEEGSDSNAESLSEDESARSRLDHWTTEVLTLVRQLPSHTDSSSHRTEDSETEEEAGRDSSQP